MPEGNKEHIQRCREAKGDDDADGQTEEYWGPQHRGCSEQDRRVHIRPAILLILRSPMNRLWHLSDAEVLNPAYGGKGGSGLRFRPNFHLGLRAPLGKSFGVPGSAFVSASAGSAQQSRAKPATSLLVI